MKKYELFLDMDDTIVDLSKYVIEIYNKEHDDNFDYTKNRTYFWSECSKVSQRYFEELLQRKGTFLNPEPIGNSIKIIKKLHEEGFKINIITVPQFHSDYCVQEKYQWIQKYLPFVNHIYMTTEKGALARPNRILLDDNSKHLNEFKCNNGIAIAFKNFTWNKDWQGLRVNNFDEFYRLVYQLESDFSTGIDVDKFREYYKCKLHK